MAKRRSVLALTTALSAVAALASMAPTAAFADATLQSTSPKNGAVLDEVPGEVTLAFNEKLQSRFTTVKVIGAGGELEVMKAITDGAKVSQSLPDTLGPGEYTVMYRVVSADGHPVSGQTTFQVKALATTSGAAPASAEPAGQSSPGTTAAEQAASAERAGEEPGGGSGPWLWVILALALVAVGGVLAAGRSRHRRGSA